jgi:hypothetical protein
MHPLNIEVLINDIIIKVLDFKDIRDDLCGICFDLEIIRNRIALDTPADAKTLLPEIDKIMTRLVEICESNDQEEE